MSERVPNPAHRPARRSLDLNLLDTLEALLDERSVSRAAQRLNVSQPTVSTSLARLRTHFDDPLLVRSGGSYRLTTLAARLKDDLPTALRAVEHVVQARAQFDASTSTREFRIRGTDYAAARVGAPLSRAVERLAPGVRLRFEPIESSDVDSAPESLRDVDGMLLPHGYLSGQPHIDVLVDEWVCLVADDNPRIGPSPTPAELLALPWVSTLNNRDAFTPAFRQLQIAGADPHVVTVTPNFFVIPDLIVSTERIAMIHRSIAERVVVPGSGLRMIAPPIALSPITEAFWWHTSKEHEVEHVWLREVLAQSTQGLLVAGAAFSAREEI